MSPDIPNQADPERAIDAAQRKLDAHDGTTDAKIDHKSVQADAAANREKLTAVYIGKVNDVQGKIADARRTVEIGKNAKSPHWQQLERACTEVERGLLERMAKIDPQTMHETVHTFDADVTALLEKLATPTIEIAVQSPQAVPEKADAILRVFGVPTEGGDTMIQAAVDRYGEDGIRAVAANIELTAHVPQSIHQELFGCAPLKTGVGVDSAKIAALLASGSLENSPYGYLLQDPAAKIRAVRESARDRSGRVQSQIDMLNGRVIGLMQRIADETKGLQYGWRDTLMDFLRLSANMQTAGLASGAIESVLPDRLAIADQGIQKLVDDIKRARPEAEKLSQQQQTIESIGTTLDIALATGAAESARLAGRTEESDRRMAQLLEKYGAGLKDTDAALAVRATESAVRLRDQKKLSSTEESLLFDDPRSLQSLKNAVEQKLAESTSVDVLDQVRAKQTFRAGSFVKFAPTYVAYNGHDASPSIRSGLRTTLSYTNGKILDVIATSQAQRVLQNIPPGKEPVLLRPISSMNIVTVGTGRGSSLALKNSPSDFIVQHTDIGFIDASGNIVRDDGKTPVDLASNENRSTIEAQIRNQKGFRMEGYRPKLPLRTLDNKPYPYGLYTIKTQSGVTVEGVTVAKDAIDLVNAEPPEGQTLVLKRIPHPADLRTPDTEQYGRGGRQYQRVLQADMVRKQDLAYAKIDGDKLTTREISSGNESSVLVTEAEKEQEEKTHDIERVLDRNPAIHGVKRSASTIQQTVGHLQKFLEAGQAGSARESFVKFAREEAKPTLEMLKDPKLRQDVEQAKIALRALKGVNGVALGGLEQKIDEQLKALDGFTAMLSDGRTQHLLETIMDASKFDADTWANFFSNQLPVIVASIVVACAAAALVVATCGAAAPFIAVAAATALGGVIGAELGKEAVYYGRQALDSRVRSGEATFSERSRFGKWAEGQQEFDEKTGIYRDREFFRDVGNPLAQEFGQAFVVTLATMGIGNVVGGQLSKLLQNSKIVDKITARSEVMKSVARKLTRLNGNKEVLEKAANLKEAVARALKSLPKEIGEEFGDEAQEQTLEQFLNHLDLALASADALDGKLGLGTVAGVLLAIGKNTRIGKATIKYDVRGKSPEALAARTQAIRAEAEGNGAIVTDLGKGYLTIRHPIQVDGQVQFETVQMEPEVSENVPQTSNAPKSDVVNTNTLMGTRNRPLYYVVDLAGTETLVRATVTDIQQQNGLWTFSMEGKLPDGSPFTSDFTESPEPDSDGFKVVEGVKILNQDEARAFALEHKMQIATESSSLASTEITEQQTALRDKSERIVGSLPPVPPGHTRVFRSIKGEYTPKQALSEAEQQELASMQQLLSQGKTDSIDQQRFTDLFNRNKPEMGGDDLLHVLSTYGNTANATLLYADIDLASRPDIDVEQRGVNGNFYVPPPGSVEWKVVPRVDSAAGEKVENSTKLEDLDTQVQAVVLRGRQTLAKAREGLASETDAGKKKKGEADISKAEKILANLESGSITLMDYQGIRDLGKVLKLPIQDQEVLARKVLENSDLSVNDVIKMDDTVGVARTLDSQTESQLAATSKQDLAKDSSLGSVIASLEAATDGASPLLAMNQIVAEVKNPLEQKIFRELLSDILNIETEVLTERERAIIFRESMEYLHDYEAAVNAGSFAEANPTAHDIFKLLQDNQRKLAHQTIVDRKFLTGSDHGVLHVIEADMRGAMKMADQLGGVLTPEARVLLHQATIDHDMGYTLNTLDTTNNYFSQTKDHPLYSGIRTAETWSQSLEQHFGPRVRDIYHTAVLDHSDVGKQPLQELVKEIRTLDTSDPQYEKKHLELQGKLVRKILALADCSGTTADIKMSKLFMEPELVGQMGQLKDLDDVRKPLQKQLESLSSDAPEADLEALHAQIAAIDRIAYEIHQQMMEMVTERYTVDGKVTEPGVSYLRALEKNFNPTDPGFAVNRDFGSHAASFEELTLVNDRPSLTYGVNDNFPIIRQRLGDKTAVSALTKAMDDFGLDLGKKPEAIVDGEKRSAYSIQDFANDLANVYAGNKTSLVVETPQGKFEFKKTESARSLELAEALNRTLKREDAIRDAIEVLENPKSSHEDRVRMVDALGAHFDDSYIVQGKPAITMIIAAQKKIGLADSKEEKAEAAREVVKIMRTIKYQGRRTLRKPKQKGTIEREAA